MHSTQLSHCPSVECSNPVRYRTRSEKASWCRTLLETFHLTSRIRLSFRRAEDSGPISAAGPETPRVLILMVTVTGCTRCTSQPLKADATISLTRYRKAECSPMLCNHLSGHQQLLSATAWLLVATVSGHIQCDVVSSFQNVLGLLI